MSEIITLQQGDTICKISTKGAEIVSLTTCGEEKIWQGQEEFWKGKAPILFPICGKLLGGFYNFEGNTYQMKGHGFFRNSETTVINKEKSTATFMLESNEETLKIYPFEFKFKVMYKLSKNSLAVYFYVENHSNKTMYYSVGCHEGYALQGDLDEYYIAFEEDNDKILNTVYDDNFTTDKTEEVLLHGNRLKLTDYFKQENYGDSLAVSPIKSKRVILMRGEKEELSVYYNDFENLILWTQFGAKFICIEPWNGLPDAIDSDHLLENKVGIKKLQPNSAMTFYHNITIY